jgi:RHS repeat-associated protein
LGGSTENYFYDGEGRRVGKWVANSAAIYVYDAFGQLATEYTTATNTPPCSTCYLNDDHLGSTRLVTDQNGNVVGRHDYLPFGEEATAASADNVNQKFTGKERDQETGLDFFTSPDWSAKPEPVPYADLSNPQSLNLYGYVLNNPLSRIDPDGHIDCTGKNAQGIGCQYIANWNKEHGIDPSAKKSNAPGVAVKLPNGKTVPDPHSPTGQMMSPTPDLRPVAAAGKAIRNEMDQIISSDNGTGGAGLAAMTYLAGALKTAVRQNGDFDYQRATLVPGSLQQLPQFRDVSKLQRRADRTASWSVA